jgi:hypothetical protein
MPSGSSVIHDPFEQSHCILVAHVIILVGKIVEDLADRGLWMVLDSERTRFVGSLNGFDDSDAVGLGVSRDLQLRVVDVQNSLMVP